MYTCTYIYVYIYIYIYMDKYTSMSLPLSLSIYIYIYVYTYCTKPTPIDSIRVSRRCRVRPVRDLMARSTWRLRSAHFHYLLVQKLIT